MPPAPAVVIASDLDVAGVGSAALVRGNAVDAVAASIFAAAGLYPGVLLGPVQLLIGGAGAGLRAVDGRTRQPGLGNPRPRGFVASETVAPAARVGVPALPAALLAASTTYGKLSVAAVLGPSIELARGRSKPRAGALQRIAERGPAALADPALADELTALAGRLASGLLSLRDLDELRPQLAPATLRTLRGGRQVATVPWGSAAVREPGGQALFAAHTRIVVATDRNGLVAVGCYEVPSEGLMLEALELLAPFTATPVRRGVPRVKPGEPREAAAPLALVQTDGVLDLAVGIGMTESAEAALRAFLGAYEPASEIERIEPLPPGLVGSQRGSTGWTTLTE